MFVLSSEPLLVCTTCGPENCLRVVLCLTVQVLAVCLVRAAASCGVLCDSGLVERWVWSRVLFIHAWETPDARHAQAFSVHDLCPNTCSAVSLSAGGHQACCCARFRRAFDPLL